VKRDEHSQNLRNAAAVNRPGLYFSHTVLQKP